MESSYIMSKGKALETFPMLNSTGLKGAIVYYDGISTCFDVSGSISLMAMQDSIMTLE